MVAWDVSAYGAYFDRTDTKRLSFILGTDSMQLSSTHMAQCWAGLHLTCAAVVGQIEIQSNVTLDNI